MTKKHILIEYNAIVEFSRNRNFTSKEFEAGSKLLNYLLINEINTNHIEEIEGIVFTCSKKGLYIASKSQVSKQGIIIDFNTFNGFELHRESALYIFQKILRSIYRHFNKHPHINAEHYFPERGLLVLFPFQSSSGFRIAIATDVDRKRQGPRNYNYLLLFNGGTESSYQVSADNIRTLKVALEHSSYVFNTIQKDFLVNESLKNSQDNTIINTAQLSGIASPIDPNIGFEAWLQHYLTSTQKKFVESEIDSPIRLEGAAGTGKTLSMVLKCIATLENANLINQPCSIIFLSHSISARNYVFKIFESNCDIEKFNKFIQVENAVKIQFFTLQEWCINFIGKKEWINENNLLELDAYDSRLHQSLFLESLISNISNSTLETFLAHCSTDFIDFYKNTEKAMLIEMLKFEFGVNIKGRANFDLQEYTLLKRSKNEIPAITKGDFNFIFYLFNKYQEYLTDQSLYDVDDIIIQALNSLNATIWKRVRKDFGFDYVFIDETHMFNLNELSIFHYLTKDTEKLKIVFAIDRSQAVGDRSFLDESLNQIFENQSSQKLNLNFRSSQEIIQIAADIVNSGTMVFSNFSNNIEDLYGTFNYVEEDLCIQSRYFLIENDQQIIENAFYAVETICRNRKLSRSKILIIGCDEYHVSNLRKYAEKANKPFEFIQHRGDVEVVKFAEQQNRFIICDIDSAGGLEFDGVIIVGIDGQKVPPQQKENGIGSAVHFQNYAWHNRLYVAITRARYFVHFFGELSCGVSKLLERSVNKELIVVKYGLKDAISVIENEI